MSRLIFVGTLPRPRPRQVGWGDHVTYNGIYAGLIVDICLESDSSMVALPGRTRDGGERVAAFATSSLQRGSAPELA